MANACRVCSQPLFDESLLVFANMPGAAQDFPLADTLHEDRGEDLSVHQCRSCGLVQLAGEPVPYFREVIRAAAFSPEMSAFRREQFQKWVDKYDLRGRKVLEVGCGRGEYLSLLRECGCDAHGIEYNAAAVKACEGQGLPVQEAYIDRSGYQVGGMPFKGFATFNFMEHWPSPVATLRGIADNLVDGGIGLVEVPNFDMVLGQGLYSEFIRDHLSYFTQDTFVFTLQTAGFEILECTRVWYDYILSAVIRKRAPLDVHLLAERRQNVERSLWDFVRRFPQGRIAVWGAGHQALAAIALSGIGRHLRYVIDSAPFKQGKFTPATHIPIVAPTALDYDPVDAVIIMAASYSDEVATLLARRPTPIPVAILRDSGLELR